jgi:hypothetical protein
MRRIHLFKAGQQTAMSGASMAFAESDLAASAAAYNPALHEAPIVVGHPATDDPAYGWCRTLTNDASGLYAHPHQVNPAFAEQVQAGAYKKVSASFYSPAHPHNPVPGVYYLRHIGFLGAQPPAVKGLKPIEFADADADADCIAVELDFSEQPTADEATEPSSLPPAAAPGGADGSPEGSTPPHQEPPTVSPEEKAALEAQNAQLQADLAEAQARLRESAAAANTAAHTAFAEQLVAQARIPAADRAVVVALLDFAEPPVAPGETPAVVEFGEGEARKPIADALRAFLQTLPARVEFTEQAARERAAALAAADPAASTVQYAEGTPAELIALDQRIRKHAEANQLSYHQAAAAIASLPASA